MRDHGREAKALGYLSISVMVITIITMLVLWFSTPALAENNPNNPHLTYNYPGTGTNPGSGTHGKANTPDVWTCYITDAQTGKTIYGKAHDREGAKRLVAKAKSAGYEYYYCMPIPRSVA